MDGYGVPGWKLRRFVHRGRDVRVWPVEDCEHAAHFKAAAVGIKPIHVSDQVPILATRAVQDQWEMSYGNVFIGARNDSGKSERLHDEVRMLEVRGDMIWWGIQGTLR